MLSPINNKKNLQNYTFGGMTNIRKTPVYNQLAPNKFKIERDRNTSSDFDTGREQLTGFGYSGKGEGDYIRLQRPTKPKNQNFYDQAYNSDIIKRARMRPQSCKSGYSRKSNVLDRIKTYKAPDPYRKSGSYFYKSKLSKATDQKSVINEDNINRFK
jgi:hypothetical protein